MRKYTVDITEPAENDILAIFRYISQNSPRAAIRWVKEIEKQIASLENFPERCPVIPEAKDIDEPLRHLIYGDYRTIFRIKDFKVYILRVLHGARLLDLAALA